MTIISACFTSNSTGQATPFSYNVFNDTQNNAIAQISSDLIDNTNASTGVTLDVTTVFPSTGFFGGGATADAGDFPEYVLGGHWRTGNGTSSQLTIGNLPVGASYTLQLIGHQNDPDRDVLFTVEGSSQEYLVGAVSAPTTALSFSGTVDSAGELVIDVQKTATGEFYGYINGFILEYTAGPTGLAVDSTDATMQRNTNFQVVCSTPTTTPTTGNTTLTNGNDTLVPSSVTGADPYTLTFPVGDLTKQVDATGYDWTLTVDLETATTGNIPLAIQAGYTKVDLVDPVTTNASLLFGVTGDTPITGDDLEYDVTSTLDSGVTLGVAATGVWTVTEAVSGDWVTDITVSRRVVQANGTIGTEAVVTLSAATGLTSLTSIVTPMVSNIVSNMVN
jgi:hypothetical protein